ncbi:hypothetical protein BD779DRAFT_1678213 [Infundibulicybe gibba]|nr:hypothetical protein BD779DRAFT_1678213 [Infundibulicybe gibba]
MPNLRVFRPIGRWNSFQWSPSLKPSPQLDTLDITMIQGMTDNGLWEFLHPLQRLTKIVLSLSNSSPDATWWQGLSSGALIPSVISITFRWVSIEVIILLLEKRLVASRAAGSGITMFTSVYSDGTRPTDPAVVPRLEALEATGVQVEFNYTKYYSG